MGSVSQNTQANEKKTQIKKKKIVRWQSDLKVRALSIYTLPTTNHFGERMGMPPLCKMPHWEKGRIIYRDELTALQGRGWIPLYSCIPANDKWVMFDSWLLCLTATVVARGPGQPLDFCSKWVKHIRYYEGTEALREGVRKWVIKVCSWVQNLQSRCHSNNVWYRTCLV